MNEIEVTDEQYEYLESLREEIKREVVGPYGHVRTVDAVQYLIDNHEGEVDVEVAAEGELDVPEEDTGTESGGDGDESAEATADADTAAEEANATEDETADDGLEAVDGIGPSRAEVLRTAGYESVTDVASAAPDEIAGELDGVSGEQAAELIAKAESESDDASNSDGGSNSSSGGMPSGGPGPSPTAPGGDSGMLSAMQQLLDEHSEKWADADGTGYEVELPDGSTESAHTKDDVRALLFRHYN